jgi:hypothetical protein
MQAPSTWNMSHIIQTVVSLGTAICFVIWQQNGMHFLRFPLVLGQAGISITWDGVTALCALIALVTGLQTFYVSSVIEKRLNKTIMELKEDIASTKDMLAKDTEHRYLSKHEFGLICKRCKKNLEMGDDEGKEGE